MSRHSYHSFLFTTCLLLCWNQAPNASGADPATAKNANGVFHQMVMQRLDIELQHMQLSMRISDDQTKLLRDAGEKALLSWTKKQDPNSLFGVKGIPQPVVSAVLTKADRRLGIAVANRYRRDIVLEKKLHRTIGVSGAVTILDQLLSLSQRQESHLRKLLAANWKNKWLNRVLTSGPERINILRPALASFDPQLKEILTPLQYRVLKTRHPSSSRALMSNMAPSEIPNATEVFRKKCHAELTDTAALRIEELKLLCNLESDQVARITDAAEDVTDEMAGELSAAFRELKVKGPGAAAPKQWRLMSSDLYLLIEQNSTWQAEVDRLLSADQREAWLNRQAARQKRWSDSTVSGIAALLGQQHRFTAGQTVAFIKVLRKEIDPTEVWSTDEHYQRMAKIDFGKFTGIFSDDQQIKLSTVFSDQGKGSRPSRKDSDPDQLIGP